MDNPELKFALGVVRDLQRQRSEIRLKLALAASVSHKTVMNEITDLATLRQELFSWLGCRSRNALWKTKPSGLG